MITFITQASLKYLQEAAAILAPQNRIQGRCDFICHHKISLIPHHKGYTQLQTGSCSHVTQAAAAPNLNILMDQPSPEELLLGSCAPAPVTAHFFC